MGISMIELFTALNERGLTFRRTTGGELEVAGDTSRLTDAIRTAIADHRQMILACLPSASSAASPEAPAAIQTANAIRQRLDEFGLWLRKFAGWAAPRYLDSIDHRLAEAVDSGDLTIVERQVESLRQEVEGVNWCAEILPMAYAAEAKHAVAAGAGPAAGEQEPDGIPF